MAPKTINQSILDGALNFARDKITESLHYIFSVDAAGSGAEDCIVRGQIAVYDPYGKFLRCELAADAVPDTPSNNPIPIVSVPPTNIYQNSSTTVVNTTYIVNNDNTPDLPARRLPEKIASAPTSKSGVKTKPGQTVTVATTVKNKQFGALLHEPITKSPVKINVATPTGYKAQFPIQQAKAANKFLLYVLEKLDVSLLDLNQPENGEPLYIDLKAELGIEDSLTLRDAALTIIKRRSYPSAEETNTNGPLVPASTPEMAIIYGCDGISQLIGDYINRSSVELFNLGGLVPLDYELIEGPVYSFPDESPADIFEPHSISAAVNSSEEGTVGEKLDKISEIIGVDRFPVSMPERLIYPNSKKDVELNDLIELLGYQVKQIDRAVGFLPQKIKIADTNPGLPGNQSVEVEIHSFADFAKEILQYVIDTEGDGDVTNNMLVRVLFELGFIHQGVVQGDAMLDAICDHLDFKERWKKIKVPFAFDPYGGQKGKVGQGFNKETNLPDAKTEEDIEDLLPLLLKNTEVEIRVLVNDEKKSLNDLLQDIKRDTATAAAGVSEKSTPERLEQLVAAAQIMLQIQSVIDRRNMRESLIAGNLKTRRIKK